MRFTTETLPLLSDRPGVAVEVGGDPARYREAGDSLSIGVSTAAATGETDWFDLGITITVEGHKVPFTTVFLALANAESFLLLPDGAYFSLEKPELQTLRKLIEEARALQDSPGGPLKISRFQIGLWDELTDIGVVGSQARGWKKQLEGLRSVDVVDSVEPPATLRADLRPYQLDGFRWLVFLWKFQLGGILADDMGLGKTLQTLALISHAKQADPALAPFLIVAPTSVVSNWATESARFAPDLKVVTISDTLRRRGQSLEEAIADADVVVTSYTLFRLDFDDYSGNQWSGLVLDEAQFTKNHQSKIYQCARQLAAPFKLAITGTPMENNLMELWSLLSITAPGLFPNPTRFDHFYARPIEKQGDTELLAQFRRRIKPLVKRRTKEQVAADLPEKQEQVLEVELHPRHRKIYQTHLQRERQKVLGLVGDMNKNRFAIFRSLTLLRQLSLHAGLIDDKHQDLACAKVDALLEQLNDVTAGGHRALIFSQFTGFLDIVRKRLDAEEIEYCYLDGKTRSRAKVLEKFKNGSAPVFLISLKAGGFGLNLTEADYCFLLDPWWNPATEAQAVDRTHRIGQTRNVMVYRLIAKDTIEEKVMALKARKAELFSSVMDEGNAFGTGLDADDIRGLFG
jgi:SNF2 family DNA or RNA helicase